CRSDRILSVASWLPLDHDEEEEIRGSVHCKVTDCAARKKKGPIDAPGRASWPARPTDVMRASGDFSGQEAGRVAEGMRERPRGGEPETSGDDPDGLVGFDEESACAVDRRGLDETTDGLTGFRFERAVQMADAHAAELRQFREARRQPV